jgi:ribosomal protein S12 methylthiotransferase
MELASPISKKVHLISLGCARNRVDSEVMLGTMFLSGWQSTDEPTEADAIVVNTCGFIQSAKDESVDTILLAAKVKKSNPGCKLIVTGCLPQRYKKQLAKGLPEVDFFLGTDEFPRIAELLAQGPEHKGQVYAMRTNYLYNDAMPRVNTLAKHSAYVKVAEGCQHNCSFCIIPAIRGSLRSRNIQSVVDEVINLVKDGVLEINLIAQDLAAYGRDSGEDRLLPLLQALVAVDGLKWIRLLYVYPENISDELLDFLATEEKIVKYLDVPVQHASDRLLSAMNRQTNNAQLVEIFGKIRNRIPDMAIRTSVMVGFPGETADDFEELKQFVLKTKFDHLGCFSYSKEEGTVAGRMGDQIDDELKESRQSEIMALQRDISAARLQKYLGKVVPVLVTGPSAESEFLWEGRLSTQAPEVDGVVYLNDGAVKKGVIQFVRITEAHDYDLVGEVIGASEGELH